MDALHRSDFLDYLQKGGGQIFLSQFEAIRTLDPALALGQRADGSRAAISEPSIGVNGVDAVKAVA